MLIEGHCCAGLICCPQPRGNSPCAFRLIDVSSSVWQAYIHAFLLDNFILALKLLSMLHTKIDALKTCNLVLATRSHGVFGLGMTVLGPGLIVLGLGMTVLGLGMTLHDNMTVTGCWSCRLAVSLVSMFMC